MSFFRTALIVPLLLLGGCAGGGGLGALGDILGALGGAATGSNTGEVRGEVQSVDTGSQRLYLRTLAGEEGSLRYDQRTQVVYRQQQYPVTALERGDLVTVQVQQAGNEVYATSIYVERSVQERSGAAGDGTAGAPNPGTLRQLDGQVTGLDVNQGWFRLRTAAQGTLTVTLPYNVDRATVDRFQRLRVGEAVAIEGYLLNQERVELYRFR